MRGVNHDITSDHRALLELRETQRRQLRAVPDQLFDNARWVDPAPALPDGAEPHAIEHHVRKVAAAALTDDALQLLDRRALAAAATWGRKALTALDGPWLGQWAMVAQKRLPEAVDRYRFNHHGETDVSIAEFAALAIVADLASDDGYRDPRVPAA